MPEAAGLGAQCGQGAGAAATAVGRASGPLESSNLSRLVKKFNPGDVSVPCQNWHLFLILFYTLLIFFIQKVNLSNCL
jgi:hypothetical protein